MKKSIMYIILFLLIALNLILFIYHLFDSKNAYIILDNKNVWKVANSEVRSISKINLKRLNYKSAKLYSTDTINGYIESDKDTFNFYTENLIKEDNLYNSIITVGDVDIKNYTSLLKSKVAEQDIQVVSEYANENGLDFDADSVVIQRAYLPNDINIYSVVTKLEDSKIIDSYSVILADIDDEIQVLYSNINNEKNRYSTINKLVDINNDGYVDIIFLSDITNNAGNECYSLYMYNNSSNSFENVINCEGDD